MHSKTIALELLDQFPTLREELLLKRMMLPALDHYSTDLKASHDHWASQIARLRPETAPEQIASEALEIAIEELVSVRKWAGFRARCSVDQS